MVKPLLGDVDAGTLVEWVRRQRVDGVISADVQQVGWLREAGVAVPGEVAYACFTRAAEMTGKAGVANNPAAIAAAAVDRVVAQLHRNERGVPAEPCSTEKRRFEDSEKRKRGNTETRG